MTYNDFLTKYNALKDTLPRSPNFCLDLENTEFAAYSYRLKNCYYCFDTVDSEHCLYYFDGVRSKYCVDGDYCVECELLYESVDTYQCYNSNYLIYCARLYDSFYCRDCMDGHDLFGCVHLKQKQYCIFNKQYSKEEYHSQVNKLLKLPAELHLQKVQELYESYPLGPTFVTHSENCDYGNHVHYAKNCYLCFDVARSENCGYMYDTFYTKNSYDLTYCYKSELCYECVDSSRSYNCDFIEWSTGCFDCAYLFDCNDCHNCWGCVGIKHKRFCILNKQYTEVEYKQKIDEIRQSAR